MAQKKIITGIQKISEYYNQKKDIRIYLLSDLHQKPFHCGRKSMKASDYILEQVELSPHEQIDLFVETAYLSNKKDTKWYRSVPKSPSPYVCGNEMKWLVSSLADCFTPGKESEFTNLRCHNVDLRDLRLHPNLKFLNILYILANAKFVYENAKHDQFNATHKRLAAHLLEERLIKKDGRIPSFSPDYIRDIKRQLKTFHSSQEAMYKLVQIEFRKTHTSHLSLFTSQLIHIPDIKVRKVIAETANKWIYIRSKNPFLRWKTLKKGLRAIINGKKTILFEERVYKTKDFLYRCFPHMLNGWGLLWIYIQLLAYLGVTLRKTTDLQ